MKILLFAIRALSHFRLYTIINILGLALSMACVITIGRYVHSELSTDHFLPELDRIYVTVYEDDQNPGILRYSDIGNPNNEASFINLLEHPAVEYASRMILYDNTDCLYNDKGYGCKTLVADSNIFKILTYPLISGTTTLTKPNEAIITPQFARKVFAEEPVLGKQLQLFSGKVVTIVGIIGEPVTASSIDFDIIVSDRLSSFWDHIGIHLVRLHPNTDYQQVNAQYNKFMHMELWRFSLRFQLYPLSKVYFNGNIENYFFRTGNFTHVWILSIVALMILLIGLFNFINIYSVVILRRGREFGMKKVFGAGSKMIYAQLYIENILMTGIALLAGWMIVEITDPLVRTQLNITPVSNRAFDLLLSGCILLILPCVTALIPYIRYNYSAPIKSLRSVNQAGGSIVSRKLFLTIQYIITFALVTCSLFFTKQLRFMLNADIGIRTEDIIETQFMKFHYMGKDLTPEEWAKEDKRRQDIKQIVQQKMDTSPLFEHWTYGDQPIKNTKNKGYTTKFKLPDGKYEEFWVMSNTPAWMKLFDLQIIEGEPISNEEPSNRGYELYISESGKKLLGIKDIESTVLQPEKRLWYNLGEDMSQNPPYRILGVFKDFNPIHLSNKNYPIILTPSASWYGEPLLASIAPGKRQEAIQFLKSMHDELIGGNFEYSFIEDKHRELYLEDLHLTQIYSIFAIIAILISSLGLFSLSLFDVQQRFREIAIRKVNGATTAIVMRMLLQKYYKLLGIAFLIATPISWLAINRYLEDFAHKASVSWWIFAVALLITAGISLATLIWQIRKAARTNPAEAIKSE